MRVDGACYKKLLENTINRMAAKKPRSGLNINKYATTLIDCSGCLCGYTTPREEKLCGKREENLYDPQDWLHINLTRH